MKRVLSERCSGTAKLNTREAVFPLAEARRAMVYLASVLEDACEAYREAQHARASLSCCEPGGRRHIIRRRDTAIARLNRTIDECHAAGVAMLDIPGGMLALRVLHRGRLMSVLWRVGEPIDKLWWEVDRQHTAVLAGRA